MSKKNDKNKLCMAGMVMLLQVFTCDGSGSTIEREEYQWRRLNGPCTADVTSIAIDPGNPLIVLAGTGGGVFHSFNGMRTWIPSFSTLNPANVSHLRNHPAEPGHYIACGNDVSSSASTLAYRTRNYGETWESIQVYAKIKDIFFDPETPDRYLAATESGVLMTLNAGQSWSSVLGSVQAYEFAEVPDEPGRLFVAISESAIAESTDMGATWEQRGDAPPRALTRSICIMDDEDKTIFLSWRFNNDGQVLKSSDGGSTWAPVLAKAINRVRNNPVSNGTIWAVGGYTDAVPMNVYVSYDNGSNWQSRSGVYSSTVYDVLIDPWDQNAVVIGKKNHGILKSNDQGQTWETSNRYLSASNVCEVELNQLDESTALIGCTTNTRVWLTDREGSRWQSLDYVSELLQCAAFKPDDPLTMMIAAHSVYRSRDGGEEWEGPSISGSGIINTIRFSPANPDIAVASVSSQSDTSGVWITYNAGDWWVRLCNDFVTNIEIDPFDPMILYADFYLAGTHRLKKSINSGFSWEALDEPALTLIKHDPLVQGRFYTRNYIYRLNRTDDGGDTWYTNLGSEIPSDINDVTVSSLDSTVYAGATGFYRSTDAGVSWTDISQNLEGMKINKIGVRTESGEEQYYAGTSSQGLWKWLPIDDEQPSIDLIEPNGGETYSKSGFFRIRWDAVDNESVFYTDILLSTDSGQSYPYVVAGGHQVDNTYIGPLPPVASDRCRIKIICYDHSWNSHADESDSDFIINAPTPTPSPVVSMTPTPDPQMTPTSPPSGGTPTPTPVGYCGDINITLNMPSFHFHPGYICYLTAEICNPGPFQPSVVALIVLDYHGSYFFAPAWSDMDDEMSYYILSFPVGTQKLVILPEFSWPETSMSDHGIRFWGLVMSDDFQKLLSNIDLWEFGFSP